MSGKWKTVAQCGDIQMNDMVVIEIGDKKLAVFNVDGEFLATAASCTHANAPLVDGYLDGEIIECPLHQGRFNIRTGKALCSPATMDLKIYPVKVVGGDVCVSVT